MLDSQILKWLSDHNMLARADNTTGYDQDALNAINDTVANWLTDVDEYDDNPLWLDHIKNCYDRAFAEWDNAA